MIAPWNLPGCKIDLNVEFYTKKPEARSQKKKIKANHKDPEDREE
jgi:hypothetical protein